MPERTLTFLLVLLVAMSVHAQTLYRIVDKDGKVTYTDVPPERQVGKDGKKPEIKSASEVKIDLNTNRADAVKPEVLQALRDRDTRAREEESEKAKAAAESHEAAQSKLAAARKALADGKDPKDDEWMSIPGGRRIPSEAYNQRLKKLESDVAAAEKAVEASGAAR
jgi:hypothetical protein